MNHDEREKKESAENSTKDCPRALAAPADTIREYLNRLGHPVLMVGRKPLNGAPKSMTVWPVEIDDPVETALWLSRSYNSVYVNLNPLKTEYLTVYPRGAVSLRDCMIAHRRRLLIDVDGHDVPLEEAERQKNALKAHLQASGEEPLVEALTGNGFCLIYPIDMPTDGASKRSITGMLKVLKEQFPCVDTSVTNPGRLTRLIGTMNVRGGVRVPTILL